MNKAKAHICPVWKPDAHNPTIIGYHVWAWIGHPLLGEVHGSMRFVDTKYQAQKIAREYRKIEVV
jgi:hypothetical protein